jgi:hypothetical protein
MNRLLFIYCKIYSKRLLFHYEVDFLEFLKSFIVVDGSILISRLREVFRNDQRVYITYKRFANSLMAPVLKW